ncbi:hypothetical protein QCD71_24750, partial [Sphingomonas sp. PsM26]|nr:hypothetical protein [Sphingomonas sp. PsM26]
AGDWPQKQRQKQQKQKQTPPHQDENIIKHTQEKTTPNPNLVEPPPHQPIYKKQKTQPTNN